MNIVWLLIAVTVSSNSSPSIIYKFSDKNNCEYAVTQLEQESKEKSGMPVLKGICIKAISN